MSYQPVSGIVPQYSTDDNELASGYYLKFYIANTTTPLSMATDSTGGTLLVKAKLNPDGLPISNPLDNDTVFIPHVNQDYRLVIYRNEADADANNTAGAFLNVPDVKPLVGSGLVGAETVTTSTGSQTVAGALDDRVVRVGSVAGLAALTPKDGLQANVIGEGIYEYSSAQSSWVKKFVDTRAYQYTQMGKLMDSTDTSAPAQDVFSAWVHGTVAYDSTIDRVLIFYNINNGHNIARNQVLLAKKQPEGGVDSKLLVASNVGVESLKCQAAGIAANGDYVALVGAFDWDSAAPKRTDIYRSTDKGLNWTVSTMVNSDDGTNILSYNGDVSGFLVLSNGRILTFAVEPSPSFLSRIFYSDDNGATWSQSTIAGSETDVTEPAWVELPNGTIICMARAAVRTGSSTAKIPAKFMKSTDSGLTWTQPVNSTSITEMTLANGHMILDEKNGNVEFVYHSRYAQGDGLTSVYLSRASYEDAENDNFFEPVRIGKLAAYTPLDNSEGDSGYIGLARTDDDVINFFYYTGKRSSAQINWAMGRRGDKPSKNFIFDEITGEKESPEGQITKIYAGDYESFDYKSIFIPGISESTVSYLKEPEKITLTVPGLGRVATKIMGGIDLTNIDRLYAKYRAASLADGAIPGIFVYSVETPSASTSDRVKWNESSGLGLGYVELDVSAMTGVMYPQFMLTDLQTSGASSSVELREFGFYSKVESGREPQEAGVDRSLYFRGNERPYLSRGWDDGYLQAAGSTVTYNEDHIEIFADGSGGQARASARTALVDLTNVNAIQCTVDVAITDPAKSDSGLAIFSTASPVDPTDGRVTFNYDDVTGLQKAYVDVRSLSGNYYIYYMCTANSDGSAPGTTTAKLLDVRLY